MANVKLLLTQNVENLGIVGDVVTVRPGYARNYLLPRALVTVPTAANVKRLAARRAEVEKEIKLQREAMEALFQKIVGKELHIKRSANEQGILFGGVSQHDIAQALRDEGFAVEDRHIRIGHQIKRLDTYSITIAFANDLKTDIKLWVVSDKPAEQLQTEPAKDADAPAVPTEEKPKAPRAPRKKKSDAPAAE